MTDNPFADKSSKPTAPKVKKAMGKMAASYADLLKACEDYTQEWKHYGSGGWLLKVFDRKKALFWLVPLEEGMRLSFALRENEKKELLKIRLSKRTAEDLSAAKKYPEGYALRIDVKTKNRYREAKRIVKQIMELR
jgi:hypothetical protein